MSARILICVLFVWISPGIVAQNALTDEVLSSSQDVGLDSYNFEYMLRAGTNRNEQGYFSSNGVWTVEGQFSWIDETGKTQTTNFIADDKGYRLVSPGISFSTFQRTSDELSTPRPQHRPSSSFGVPSGLSGGGGGGGIGGGFASGPISSIGAGAAASLVAGK